MSSNFYNRAFVNLELSVEVTAGALSDQTSSVYLLWKSYTESGHRAYEARDYKNAFHLFFRAWRLAESMRRELFCRAVSRFNLALIYVKQNRLSKARRFLRTATAMVQSIYGQENRFLPRIYDCHAEIEIGDGNLKKARYYLESANRLDWHYYGVDSRTRCSGRSLLLCHICYLLKDGDGASVNCRDFINIRRDSRASICRSV